MRPLVQCLDYQGLRWLALPTITFMPDDYFKVQCTGIYLQLVKNISSLLSICASTMCTGLTSVDDSCQLPPIMLPALTCLQEHSHLANLIFLYLLVQVVLTLERQAAGMAPARHIVLLTRHRLVTLQRGAVIT